MANDNLKNLRAQVRKRRSAVTAKENRIKRNTGIDMRNTNQDPRRPLEVVDRYNSVQLKKYLGELDRFMSRSNGFVAGAGGLIPRNEWNAYVRLEKQYNSIGAMHFQEIADMIITPAGMTIREREQLMVPASKRAQGDVLHRPYSPLNRSPENIKDIKALEKLKKSLETKVKNNFLPAQIKAGRKQLEQMLVGVGNGDIIVEARKLTDEQFNILWNYTGFATSVSRVSPSGTHRSKNVQDADAFDINATSVVEDFSSDIREFFDWAKSIKLPKKSTKRTKKS